jgi:tetratricopeptide (TPR) repeat protein
MQFSSVASDDREERFLLRLLTDRPRDPEVLRRLALVRLKGGQAQQARDLAAQAVEAAPADALCLVALAEACLLLGQAAEARRHFEAAVALDASLAAAWFGLGEALAPTAEGGGADAVAAYRKAVALAPGDPKAALALMRLMVKLGRNDDAIAAARMAATSDLQVADLLNTLGLSLDAIGRRGEAVMVLRSLALLRPDVASVYDNLGNVLLSTGQAAEAEACHRRALSLGSQSAMTWSNLGNALHRQGRLDESEAAYRRALDLAPNVAKFHTNLALTLLLAGRFEEGWREYEWRWHGHPGVPAYLRERAWDGRMPFDGGLLLQAEQGYGDTIQFIRYAPLLKARGVRRVIVACQPELLRLLHTAPGVDEVVPENRAKAAFDAALTMMSLARVFDTGEDGVPGGVPYLAVPPGAGVTLPVVEGCRFKVGIAWAGRPTHGDDWNRSIPARLLAPLLDVPGVAFYSLQRGAVAERLGRPPVQRVVEIADHCADFADTAAVISAMDLIISVDTAVVHLAGALGKPVWVLVPPVPDFRWRMQGETSPWYPSLRLFRRRFDAGWEPVITQVASLLRESVAAIG